MNIVVTSISDLRAAAAQIIPLFEQYRVVALYGAMGAGKTTLIREIAAHMGVVDSVSSPTFSLVNHYLTATGESIYHFDFYRIETLSEAFDFGYEEYFYGGDLCLIEWPEKIEELLPDEFLKITITPQPNGTRDISIG